MVVEVSGRYVRVSVRKPLTGRSVRFVTISIGRKGHTKLVKMFYPVTNRWIDQSWLFPIVDVVKGRSETVRQLKKLGVLSEARFKAKKSFL